MKQELQQLTIFHKCDKINYEFTVTNNTLCLQT
jgi:hypothetical protein